MAKPKKTRKPAKKKPAKRKPAKKSPKKGVALHGKRKGARKSVTVRCSCP